MQDKCTCDEEQIQPHTCPFSEELYNDSETLCQCCDYCSYQCCMDI